MNKDLANISIGIGITGSFCTFAPMLDALERLKSLGANLIPVFSERAFTTDSRFGYSKDFYNKTAAICNNRPVTSIPEAEPLGPKSMIDVFLILPCTGNTLSKLANGICDSSVLMAAKSTLRNNRPVIIFLSSNDSLGLNLKNIGTLINSKNVYFVPFGQDNPASKPNSMISYFDLIPDTITEALNKSQLQPVCISPHKL